MSLDDYFACKDDIIAVQSLGIFIEKTTSKDDSGHHKLVFAIYPPPKSFSSKRKARNYVSCALDVMIINKRSISLPTQLELRIDNEYFTKFQDSAIDVLNKARSQKRAYTFVRDNARFIMGTAAIAAAAIGTYAPYSYIPQFFQKVDHSNQPLPMAEQDLLLGFQKVSSTVKLLAISAASGVTIGTGAWFGSYWAIRKAVSSFIPLGVKALDYEKIMPYVQDAKPIMISEL